jgi:hypothetical protein
VFSAVFFRIVVVQVVCAAAFMGRVNQVYRRLKGKFDVQGLDTGHLDLI